MSTTPETARGTGAARRLSLTECLGHAWRVGSLKTAAVLAAGNIMRALGVTWWANYAPWYTGRLLQVARGAIRIDGRRFELPVQEKPFLAGLAWLESYETQERYAVARFLPHDLPVVELGGSAGVVATLTNGLLDEPARHVVVEANPVMAAVLERNRQRHDSAFTVLNAAVAYGAATVEFGVTDNFLASSLAPGADQHRVSVPAASLAGILAQAGFERCSLVCDIEGAEIDLVKNEGDLLTRVVDTLLLEVHPGISGVETVRWLGAELSRLGFERIWECGDVWYLRAVSPTAA